MKQFLMMTRKHAILRNILNTWLVQHIQIGVNQSDKGPIPDHMVQYQSGFLFFVAFQLLQISIPPDILIICIGLIDYRNQYRFEIQTLTISSNIISHKILGTYQFKSLNPGSCLSSLACFRKLNNSRAMKIWIPTIKPQI